MYQTINENTNDFIEIYDIKSKYDFIKKFKNIILKLYTNV